MNSFHKTTYNFSLHTSRHLYKVSKSPSYFNGIFYNKGYIVFNFTSQFSSMYAPY